MNRFAITAFSLILTITAASNAHAQELCLTVMPIRAALLSDGTLGLAFVSIEPGDPFQTVRRTEPSNRCFGADAVSMMKRSCTAFLAKYETPTTNTAQEPERLSPPDCRVANGTIETLANENARLKRAVRALRIRALRR